MMEVARVWVAGCLLAVGLAGKVEAATRYAWLDGARLFVVSSEAEALAGIFVLDYDVVPPWNGSVRLGTFPVWPRVSRGGFSAGRGGDSVRGGESAGRGSDRHFLFAIIENLTRTVLFLARLENPATP